MTNVDPRLDAWRNRIVRRELEHLQHAEERAEDIAGIIEEMRCAENIGPSDIAGVKMRAKEDLAEIKKQRKIEKETAEKRAKRETAEHVRDSLGPYADMPLGIAAIERARAA